MRRKYLLSLLCLMPASAIAQEASEKITYEDHVRPILRQHCFSCHNQNEKKGGLALDSYGATIEGGAGGEVVFDGDSGSSRLWQLMAHEDTPIMPPGQDKLPDELINTVKAWIDNGMLENAGSKAKKKKGGSLAFSASADGRPEGPPPMPESVWKQPTIVTDRPSTITALRSSPWAPLLAVSGQTQVILYNTDSGDLVGVLPFPEGEPQSLTFSRDGRYLLVGGGHHSAQGMTVAYDIKTGDRVGRAGDELDTVLGSDVNHDVSRVALGGPQRLVRIHDLATGEQLFQLKKHTDWVYSVRYSPDGVLVASGDRAGGLILWEADTGRLYYDLIGHKDAVRGIAWRSDSNVVASASMDGTVKLWDVFSGKEIKNIAAHNGGVTGIDMHRDGRLVTCGKDGSVKLWDANGNAVRDFPAFSEAAMEVCFSHDGAAVIAGDWSGQVRMWKADDATPLHSFQSNPATLETRLQTAKQIAAERIAQHDAQAAIVNTLEGELNATASKLQESSGLLEVTRPLAVAAETKRIELQGAADTAAATLQQLQESQKAVQQRVTESGQAAEGAKAKVTELQTKLDTSLAAIRVASEARDAAAKNIEQVDAQISALQAVQPVDSAQLENLANQRAAFAAQHAKQIAAIDAAQQTFQQLSAETKSALDAMMPAQQAMLTAQLEFSNLQTQLAAARDAAQRSSFAAKEAKVQAESLAAQVKMIESQVNEYQGKVAELTPKRDEARAVLEPLIVARDLANQKVVALEADLVAFSGERDKLVASLQSLESQVSTLTADMAAKQQATAEADQKFTTEDGRLAELRKMMESLQAEVDQLRQMKNERLAAAAAAAELAEQAEAEKQKLAERKALFEAAYPAPVQ